MTIIELPRSIRTVRRRKRCQSPADYELRLATSAAEVRAVLRLRERTSGTSGVDGDGPDGLDRLAEHLVVWHRPAGSAPEVAVAAVRLLSPLSGRRVWAARSSFDLGPLSSVLPEAVEASEIRVDPEHASTTVISLLWSGVTRYLEWTGHRFLLACESIPLSDGGGDAAAFFDAVRGRRWAQPALLCPPHLAFDPQRVVRLHHAVLPPLAPGYLQLGATACAAPAWDPTRDRAEFLVLLDRQRTDPRLLRRFAAAGV